MLNKKKLQIWFCIVLLFFLKIFVKDLFYRKLILLKNFAGIEFRENDRKLQKIKNKKKEGVEKLKIWLTHSRYHLYQPKMKPNGLF